MKKLSSQSEQYLATFARWLRWYPARFRQQFGEEMQLLLRDQLRDAERSGDSSMLREVYWRALTELPGSIIREQVGAVWNFEDTISRWKLFNYWYLITVAVAAIVVILPSESSALIPPPVIITVLVPLVSITFAAWRYSGRISLALITGASFFGVVGLVSLLAMIFPTVADYIGLLPIVPVYFSLLALFAGTPYFLLFWFYTHPKKFARRALATLSDEELEALRLANARKRKIALIALGVIAIILIVPNLAGLYDPAFSATRDYPKAHIVQKEQNAYYILSTLSLPIDVYNPHWDNPQPDLTPYVTGKGWDEDKIRRFLLESEETHIQFSTAASLSQYQVPSMENPENEPIDPNIPIPDFSPTTVAANLELIRAREDLRTGNLDTAIQSGINVLRVYSAIDSSNGFFIQHLVALNNEENALSFLLSLPDSYQLSTDQAQRISTALPSTSSIWENTKNALRWEEYYNVRNLPGYQNNPSTISDLLSNYMGYLPYVYQPNRTARLMSDHFNDILTQIGSCPSKIQPPPETSSSFATFRDYLKFNGLGQVFAKYSLFYFDSSHECTLISAKDLLLKKLETKPTA